MADLHFQSVSAFCATDPAGIHEEDVKVQSRDKLEESIPLLCMKKWKNGLVPGTRSALPASSLPPADVP